MELASVFARIRDLNDRCESLRGIFDYEGKSERLQEVTRELESADIWNTPEKAQALGKNALA